MNIVNNIMEISCKLFSFNADMTFVSKMIQETISTIKLNKIILPGSFPISLNIKSQGLLSSLTYI